MMQSPPTRGIGLTRRQAFQILPNRVAGCLGCTALARCASAQNTSLPWTEKADMTWEAIFRFAYQKDFIPLMQGLASRIGREKLAEMIQETWAEAITRKTDEHRRRAFDFSKMVQGFKNPPPMIAKTLVARQIAESPSSFEYEVTNCLWAKTFRDAGAGDLGYAIVCYPDIPIARSLSPNLRLERTQTLMQGADSCRFKYVFENA